MIEKPVTPPRPAITQTDGAKIIPAAQAGASQEQISMSSRGPASLVSRTASSAPASPQAALIVNSVPISTGVAPRLRARTMMVSRTPKATPLSTAAQMANRRSSGSPATNLIVLPTLRSSGSRAGTTGGSNGLRSTAAASAITPNETESTANGRDL